MDDLDESREPTSEPLGDPVESEHPHHSFLDGLRHPVQRRHHDAPIELPKAQTRHVRGCLAGIIGVAVVVALGVGVVLFAAGRITSLFAGPPDYPGPGRGRVLFQVHSGDTTAAIGRNLKAQDIVKSVEAFTGAAKGDAAALSIQVGYYQLRKQMAAQDALALLEDPANLVQSLVTVTEGSRLGDIVSVIVAKTDIKRSAVAEALKHPGQLGLPSYAHGNPEGFLFPATYTVVPGEDAVTLLREMVAKAKAEVATLQLKQRGKQLGLTVGQVFTVASILEWEANNGQDYRKVARVIYNRLAAGMPLELDSTVAYVSKRKGDVWTTAAERANDSAYNTYQHAGLPPGPIGAPGEATLKAALNPAKGPWLYFVADFKTGRALFAATYAQHLKNVAKVQQYCRTHKVC